MLSQRWPRERQTENCTAGQPLGPLAARRSTKQLVDVAEVAELGGQVDTSMVGAAVVVDESGGSRSLCSRCQCGKMRIANRCRHRRIRYPRRICMCSDKYVVVAMAAGGVVRSYMVEKVAKQEAHLVTVEEMEERETKAATVVKAVQQARAGCESAVGKICSCLTQTELRAYATVIARAIICTRACVVTAEGWSSRWSRRRRWLRR
jgi:hypothetical protein